MSADFLQKIFRTLGDPTRVRLLLLLEREELAVQELMEVVGMAQSGVSRHLGILREAGLVRDRRDGTYALYRFQDPEDEAWRDAWALARRAVEGDAATERDRTALARVLAARAARGHGFFDVVGGEWDALRKVWGDDQLRSRAITQLVPRGLRVADVGAGTGVLALELARLGCSVVAVDSSKSKKTRIIMIKNWAFFVMPELDPLLSLNSIIRIIRVSASTMEEFATFGWPNNP